MNRKDFLKTTGLFGASTLATGCAVAGNAVTGKQKEGSHTSFNLADIPIFCGHEHWGSFNAIGSSPTGFNADKKPGALPER